MSDTPNLDELKELSRQLAEMMDDPHPGLFTWCDMLNKSLAKDRHVFLLSSDRVYRDAPAI